jgi:hypothetical protein
MSESAKILKLRDVVEAELAGGFAGNTNVEIETWLKATDTLKRDVSHDNLMTWLARNNGINKLEAAKVTGTTDTIKSAAAYLLMLAQSNSRVRLSDDEVRGFLNNLVPEIFSAAERADLLAFSDSTVARHIIYGVSRGIGAIERARVAL